MCYAWHMRQVEIRALRQQAGAVLRRVERGETIEVTDRGRPVTLLSPLPGGGPMQRLRASGDVAPADGDLSDLPEHLSLAQGQAPSSTVLARLRQLER